jgi:antibiotic biosynthesis monooxygenase (ABM) superfamily enzyme
MSIGRPDQSSGDGATRLPVTVVLTRHPAPGRSAELADWAHGITEAASRFPGHLGAQILPSVEGESDDLTLAFTFASAEELSAWEDSAERLDWLARSEQLTVGHVHAHDVTGFEDLFAPSVHATTSPPPRWKTGVVIALALFPMSLLLNWLLMPQLTSWNVVLRVALSVVLLVPWMIYAGVPYLTKWLRPWLVKSR